MLPVQEQASTSGRPEEQELPFPDLPPVAFWRLHQTTKFRAWCINIARSSWLRYLSVIVILVSSVSLGMYSPGEGEQTYQKVLKGLDFAYFLCEMMVKMVAQGAYGHRGSYLADKWNKIDAIIACGQMLDYIVSAFGVNFGVGHALRPIRLISRIQSFRDLVSILLDSVPMLGNVLIVYLFVIHIFAVIGVQLWGGELRNRCFLGEDILTLVHHFPYLKRQLMVLYRSIEEASTLCWLMLFYIFIFGVVGMYLFGCKFVYISPDGDPADDRKNFDSLLWSMVTVFQILTLEDWNLVLFNAMASTSAWAALCFIALIVIGKNVLLNVIVGIVVRNFQSLPTVIPTDNTPPPSTTLNPEDGPTTSTQSDPTNIAGEASAPTRSNWSDARLIRRVLPWCKEREDWTFYLVPPENKFRTFCKKLTDDTRFDIGILLVILLCCFTIAFERPGISPNSTERWILDSVCHSGTFVFTVEMFLKVMANGLIFGEGSYIKCSWNILDGSLVITSLVNICITVVTSGKAKRLSTLKVIRLLRALRPLRMIKKTSRLKLAVEALMASVKPVANILLICGVFFFFFYGTLGVQLFKGKFFHCVGEDVTDIVSKSECLAADYHWVQKNYNFDNILQALMSLFVMYSKNGWVNLMYDGLDAVAVDIQPVRNYNELALAYFVVFVSFFLLDMFISIIAETFCQCQQMQQLEVEESGRQVHSLPSNQQELEPFYVNYSTVRRFIYKVCSTRAFDLFVPALIIINVGIMSFEHYGQPQYLTQISDYSFYVFTLLLIGEMVLKLIAFGPVTFLKNSCNLLDIAIVIVSVVSILLGIMGMRRMIPFTPSTLRVFRISKVAQVLRTKRLRVLIKTVIKTLSRVGNICLLFMFFSFIFSTLGVELFGNLVCTPDYPCLGLHRHSNFRNFPMAMFTLYRVCTGDNWSGILKDTMRECRPDDISCVSYLFWVSPIYFASFVIVAQFVLGNLVVASIMQALKESREDNHENLR